MAGGQWFGDGRDRRWGGWWVRGYGWKINGREKGAGDYK